MPPLPRSASIWYWPSSTVSTIDAGSASSTSPSIEQKLTLSSYFVLQAVQYFIQEWKTRQHLRRCDFVGLLYPGLRQPWAETRERFQRLINRTGVKRRGQEEVRPFAVRRSPFAVRRSVKNRSGARSLQPCGCC